MNKKSILFKITALAAVFTLNISLYTVLSNSSQKVEAYSNSNLPTTINLNDCSEQTIRSYYSSLNSLDVSERQGNNLLKNLKTILKNGQKYLSYDSGNNIWDVYCIVDRDWNKSPASSLPAAAGTYNEATNTITNYNWGKNSSTYENPYLHALYYNRDKTTIAKAYGDHNTNTSTGINREHIWPKGAGFDTNGAGGARGDIMHLWAANGHVNNIHNNNYYGYVDTDKSYTDIGNTATYSMCAGNLSGKSKTIPSSSNTVFEPQDSDKGDIARACFYMVARYNYISASDSDGINSNNPNLELVNNLSSFQNSGYTSSTSTTGKLGILQDLLEWNRLDPPDEFEIHRNNLCYNNFTNNRNPFIDFPSWADAIWGTSENGNYNPSITTSASPATDPITSIGNSFTISADSLSIQVGGTAGISASNAQSNISWTVANNTIVSLNKNSTANDEVVTITALKAGTTTITATSGGDSLTCIVTVNDTINYGSEDHPLSVDEAISVINVTGTNETPEPLYVKGIVSSNTAYKGQYSNYDEIWLEDNDGTAHSFELYRAKRGNGVTGFEEADSMVGKEIVAYGYGKVFKGQPELTTSSNIPTAPTILSITDPLPAGDNPGDYLNGTTTSYMELDVDETPITEPATVTKTTNTLRTENSWTISSGNNVYCYKNFSLDSNINVSTTGQDNCGSIWGSGTYDWRLYQNRSGNVIISAYNGCRITSVTFTFNTSNGGELRYGDEVVESGTQFDISSLSKATFTVANSGSGTSGQVRITSFSVTYSVVLSTTVNSVAINYGARISASNWNAINNLEGYEITDYGCMLVKRTTLDNTYHVSTVEEAYEDEFEVCIANKGSGATPNIDGSNYFFYIKLNITKVANYSVTYVAAPFIKVNNVYYFLDEIECSVNSLAEDYLAGEGSTISNAALNILAGN